MMTIRDIYERPYSKAILIDFQGIVCESPGNLEPIEPGEEHEW